MIFITLKQDKYRKFNIFVHQYSVYETSDPYNLLDFLPAEHSAVDNCHSFQAGNTVYPDWIGLSDSDDTVDNLPCRLGETKKQQQWFMDLFADFLRDDSYSGLSSG